METRILLGGGGSAQDEGAVMERLAAWVGGGPLLYLPIAAEEVGQGHWEWIWSALEPLGVTRIGMWGTLSAHLPAELDDFRGVLIGGGNTFHLLHQLRASGFDGALRGYAERGGVLYGGSAGAIVLGRDIGTAAYMDENVTGDADAAGLDLLHGDSVWCHYRPSDDPLICAYVERTGWATLALPENGGAWVRGAQDIAPLGAGEVVRFTKEGKRVL